MNLFSLTKEDKEVRDLLDTLKVDNVAFLMENRESTCISCTCGFCDTVKKGRGEVYEYHTMENRQKIYFCPNCKTEIVYDIYDEDTAIPIKYISNVLRDDEESIDVKITQFLVERCGPHLDSFKSDESILVRYLKKEKRFAFLDMDERDSIEDIEYLAERDNLKYFFGSYSTFYEDYNNNQQNNAYIGLKEIIDSFSPYLPSVKEITRHEEVDLFYILLDMVMRNKSRLYAYIEDNKVDIGWGMQSKYSNLKIYAEDIDKVEKNLEFLKENGVDINADSLEKATGFTEAQLLGMRNYSDLIPCKKFYDNVNKTNLESYFEELGIHFQTKDIIQIGSLYDKSKADDFESFIKFICRGHKNENCPIESILEMMEDMMRFDNDDTRKLLNYRKAFSLLLYKQFLLIKNEVVTFDMLEKFSKKPTIDNLVKIIS